MKITNLCTSILTKHSDDVISTFEALGFERLHHDGNEEGIVNGSIRLKDHNGNMVDIVDTDHYSKDKVMLHINVDDFDEAYRFFMDREFSNALGKDVIIEAEHFKGAHIESPSGFEIMLMQHIRK